jgi:hypothetical protein
VKSILRRVLAVGTAAALCALAAAPAAATPATLKRSVENLTQWPLDIVTAPWVAGQTIYQNMQSEPDTTAVKIVYPVPGYAWNLMVQLGASVLRGVTGVIEFVPGLILLPLDAEFDPLYDPVVDNPALVDVPTSIYSLRFGITYTTGGY